jgi:hypothetical protein
MRHITLVLVALYSVCGAAQAAEPVVQVPAPATTPARPAASVPPAPPSSAQQGAGTATLPAAPATAAPVTVAVPAPVPADALPPMTFYASVAPDELLANIKAASAFSQVDKELIGSPIQLRITHSLQPTAGGQAAGLLSAVWAGSTLGLLPVVTNNNLVLVYEVRVNGKDVARYDFQRSFTRAIAIWGAQNDPTHGLGAEGLEWARSTATEFAAKAAQDPALLALAKEYRFYFGAQKN